MNEKITTGATPAPKKPAKPRDERLDTRLNRRGDPILSETNSGIPVEGGPMTERPESIQDLIKRMIRGNISEQAEAEGFGGFDQEDDFEEDDPETLAITHHEVAAMDDEEIADYALEAGVALTPEAPQEGAPGNIPPEASGERPAEPAGAPERDGDPSGNVPPGSTGES